MQQLMQLLQEAHQQVERTVPRVCVELLARIQDDRQNAALPKFLTTPAFFDKYPVEQQMQYSILK